MAPPTILVPVFPGTDFIPQLDAALQLSRGKPGHIHAVFIRPDPGAKVTSIGEVWQVATKAKADTYSLADMLDVAGVKMDACDGGGPDVALRARLRFEEWRAANDLEAGLGDGPAGELARAVWIG